MTPDARPAPRSPRLRRVLSELAVLAVVALVTAALVRAFVLQAFYVPSGSMRPTIDRGERIVVTKLGDVERGDIVVFEDPGSWLGEDHRTPGSGGAVREALEFVGVLPPGDARYLVKRLVGRPGDHVVCCDVRGRVSVNGEPLDEHYLRRRPEDAGSPREFDVVVPRGAIWVLGDNRTNSGDSRAHLRDGTAFVDVDAVVGRAFAAVWPPEAMRRLGEAEVFASVPDAQRPAPERPKISDARDPGLGD